MNDRSTEIPTPDVRVGDVLESSLHGPSRVTRLSSGPVPWPMGRPVDQVRTGPPAYLIYGELERALHDWTAPEITATFGLSRAQVTKLRRSLLSRPKQTRQYGRPLGGGA